MKRGFTFIEMIFVIVIMGILAKFGAEIFRNVYLNYNQSVVNNDLQARTEAVIEQVGNRLQYRIKNSVVAATPAGTFSSASTPLANSNTIAWVGYDIDGWLGDGASTNPTWSGFIDVDDIASGASALKLISPSSDFTDSGRVEDVIVALGGAGNTDAVVIFTGSNSDALVDYRWNTGAAYAQNNTAVHKIQDAPNQDEIIPSASLAGVDIYEQYKLAWTAYALEHNTTSGDLTLYYNFQPWNGENFNAGDSSLLMENVDTFKFQAVGDMIKIQVCINDNNLTGDGGYSLCKEKSIF